MKTIQQQISESDSQVVETIDGRSITRAEMRAAFDRVADKANWKNPIDAIVPVADAADLELVLRAVVFFAGCRATSTPVTPLFAVEKPSLFYRISAVGYYAAVGA